MHDLHRPGGWRRRFAVFAAAVVGLTATLAVVAATPAHADDGHCTPSEGLGDFHFTEDRWLRTFTITSLTAPEIFIPTETIVTVNPSEEDATATATVTRSMTVSVTTTLEVSTTIERQVTMGLKVSSGTKFSRQTTESSTTTVGVTQPLPLPPRGRAEIDYGVFVIEFNFVMRVFYKDSCALQGITGEERAQVPLIKQGFGDGRYWPVINLGGIVNGSNYRGDDIHPGTTVAIFGQYFVPQDVVSVAQGGNTYIITDGSEWWWDSDPLGRQINATVPEGLVPGTATVSVTTADGRVSNARSIIIQP